MNSVERIQTHLGTKETCRFFVEGSLVSGWTRLPHYFAIVCSDTNSYGLLIFSHPGIGSKDTTVHSKYALPIDKKFKFTKSKQLTNNHYTSEIQLEISSASIKYLVEFVTGASTQEFIRLLSELSTASHNRTNVSFEWLTKYNSNVSCTSTESSDDWPWREITQLSSTSTYTPIAFDADDDILSFDPLAPPKKESGNEPLKNKDDDLLGDFENIEVATSKMNINQKQKNTRGFELFDFDPLSKDELDQGNNIESGSLKRSGEVVSNRTSTISSQQKNNVEETFDVVQQEEVNSPNNAYSTLLTVDRSVSRARESFIKLHLAAREKDFTDLFPFTIFVGTWNVNGQYPTESLKPWLQSPSESLMAPITDSRGPPDIYAIGFQELDLSAEAFVFNDSSREDQWIKCIEDSLPPGDYFKVKVVRLIGMMLAVYVHGKHKMQIKNVEAETLPTGIMGMLGNKGGVAIRLEMHHTSICFVNCHLAAHMAEVERRNQDFNAVYSNLKFTLFDPPLSVAEHNMVFWLGDLNYRINDLSVEQVKQLSSIGDFHTLYASDQLNKQRSAGKCFKGFTELQPLFKPTYKFDPGTDIWDTSEKARAPAWCDRILWKGKHIEQVSYGCHPDLKLSDHKPVSACFNVNVKVVDVTRERKVFEEIVRKLDREENESLPQVKLEKQELSFGDVNFLEKHLRTLPVANIGQRTVQFSFIPKNEEKSISMPWFKVSPDHGFIMPGDFTEIEITLCVDKESACQVAKAGCQLHDILVLHLQDGKDFFVPLSATYKPSVFGTSLETLVRTYGAIKDVPIESLIKLENLASSNSKFPETVDPLEIPKELWRLIDHIHKHGMTKQNILRQEGIGEELIAIRTHLDTNIHEGKIPGNIYSVGEALLLFLETIPEPVIPYRFHTKCFEACNNYVLCKQVVNNMPLCHFNVFRYLCAFLRELLKYSAENELDPKILATIFGPIFLRFPTEYHDKLNKRTQSQLALKKAKFVIHFLVNDFR